MNHDTSKMVENIHEVLVKCGAHDGIPLCTIEELRDMAYKIAGEPEKVQFGDHVVGIIESRDGTIMDVVREINPFTFDE